MKQKGLLLSNAGTSAQLTNGFPIHTLPPLREGLMARLHPRESGEIYLYKTNKA